MLTMKNTSSSLRLPIIALLISIVGIGAAPLFVVMSEVDPTATVVLRMFVASIILMIVPYLGRWQQQPSDEIPSPSKVKLFILLLLSSVVFGADVATNHWAVTLTSVANASMLMNISPIFTLIVGWLFLKESITYLKSFAVLVAIIGGSLMISDDFSVGSDFWGEFLAIFSAFLYACYLMSVETLRKHLSAKTIIFANSLITSLMLLPIALSYSPNLFPTTIHGMMIIAALAICTQILGHGLLAYALKHIDATTSALSTLARPLVSIVGAYFFLGQTISIVQGIGISIVFLSMYLFNYQTFHQKVDKTDAVVDTQVCKPTSP